MDDEVKFNSHIKSIVSKVEKSNGILYRMCKFLSMEANIISYNAFVYPYLSYNISIWGNSHVYTQKRAIRCITDAEYNARFSLINKYQLLKIEDIVEYVLCIHMYKSIKANKYSHEW